MAKKSKGGRSAVIRELLANQEPKVSEPTHTSKKIALIRIRKNTSKSCQKKQGLN